MGGLLDLLSGISVVGGAAYLGVSYLAGAWPFTRIKENVYEITRYFTGHRGPALKGPRTALCITPFIQKVQDKEGNIAQVSRQIQDRDTKLHFRTNDNFEGDQPVQYNYRVPDEQGAKKFYWDINQDIGLIDEIVHARISKEIGKRNADNLPKEESVYLEELVNNELGREDNSNILYKNFGVVVTNISSGPLDFVPESQRILSMIQQAEREAEAKKIKAHAEAYATQVKAEATKKSLDVYVDSAKELLRKIGVTEAHPNYHELLYNKVGDMYNIDNYQTMAENGGVIVTGNSSRDRIIPVPGFGKKQSSPEPETPSPESESSEAPKAPFQDLEDILGE